MSPPVTDEGTIETPLHEVGQTVRFETQVHAYDRIRNGIVLHDVDFFLNDQFLGNVEASNFWSVDVTLTEPGIHAMIAIGHDAAGNEYPAFRTVLVASVVPEPTTLAFVAIGCFYYGEPRGLPPRSLNCLQLLTFLDRHFILQLDTRTSRHRMHLGRSVPTRSRCRAVELKLATLAE